MKTHPTDRNDPDGDGNDPTDNPIDDIAEILKMNKENAEERNKGELYQFFNSNI
jgi:hypothetical protein